jgi:hypothetical protein
MRLNFIQAALSLDLNNSTLAQDAVGPSTPTEAVPGALPRGRNSLQKVPFGLYAEQRSFALLEPLAPSPNLPLPCRFSDDLSDERADVFVEQFYFPMIKSED